MLSNRKDQIDISYIRTIIKFEPGHPVYLLKDVVGAKLVLKREEGATAEGLHQNARLLGSIAKGTKPVVATNQEMANIAEGLAHHHFKSRFGDAIADDLYLQIIKPGGTWWKLPFVEGLTSLEAAAKNHATDPSDKSAIRNFAKALNRSDGCEKLGELLAFDLFMNNTDRFHPEGGGLSLIRQLTKDVNPGEPTGLPDDMQDIEFQVLVNIGNVFAAADGQGRLAVAALDSWDPNATYGDLSGDAQERDLLLCRYLKDDIPSKTSLGQYASKVVADINAALGPRKRAKLKLLFNARTERLKADAGQRVFNGMRSGAGKLKAKLQRRVPANGYPPGVQARMAELGW